jgi:cupin 2 domain-containing protein
LTNQLISIDFYERQRRGNPAFAVRNQETPHVTPEFRNILADLPPALTGEAFETIIAAGSLCIERIVSNGQVTPEGEWYDQARDEWILLLAGSADLVFDDGQEPHRLAAGDHARIPAGCRHRVSWTDPTVKTVWLAVHFLAERMP